MSDAPQVMFYDVSTDGKRPVTQADVDSFHDFALWHLEMREIVSVLTQRGANKRFTREQLRAVKEILGI